MNPKDPQSDPFLASKRREGSDKSAAEIAASAATIAAAGSAAITVGLMSGSVLPLAGGIVALVDKFFTERALERLRVFVVGVEERLGEIRAHIDQLEDRRQDQVVRILLEARFASEREKLERLRNATANAVATNIDDIWFGALHECLTQVTTSEVLVLRAFYSIPESERRCLNERDTGLFSTEQIPLPSPEVEGAMPMMIQRLVRLGLIADVTMGRLSATPISCLDKTELGRRFLWLVTDKPGTPMPE